MKDWPEEVSLDLELDEPDDEQHLRARVADSLRVAEAELPELVLFKRSIDARRGKVRFHLTLGLGGQELGESRAPLRELSGPPRVVIVGDGPAGLFCAYELARLGVRAIIVDRGKPV